MDEVRVGGPDGQVTERGRAGVAEWVALGAVVAGSVGAIVGATRSAHNSRASRLQVGRPDSATLTAPHGDKIPQARE